MYITVLQGNIGLQKWIAVQHNSDLNVILNDKTFDSGQSHTYEKSDSDVMVRQGIDLYDNGAAAGAGAIKANVYKISQNG